MADTLSTEEILSIFPKAVVEEIQQEWAAFIADEYNSRSWTALYHLAKAFAPPPRFIAIDPDELRALRESHDALFMALREQGFLVRVGAAVSKTTWACRVGCHKYDWCEVSPDGAPFGFYVYQCERCEKPGAPSKAQQAIIMNRMLIEYADAALAYLEALEAPNERP